MKAELHHRAASKNPRIWLPVALGLVLLFAWISAAPAQPEIVIVPESYDFNLPLLSSISDVMNVSNIGDETLNFEIELGPPRRDDIIEILIWTPFADDQFDLPSIYNCIRTFDIDYRLTEQSSVDLEQLQERLEFSHVLLIPEMQRIAPDAAADLGNACADVLQDFMEGQGGVIVALDYNTNTATFLDAAGLLTIEVQDRVAEVRCRAVMYHPISSGVDEYLSLAGTQLFTPQTEDALVISQSIDDRYPGVNLVARQTGNGGLVYFGMDWRNYNADMARLLKNAITWSQAESNWLTLENYSTEAEPFEYVDVVFHVDTSPLARPGNYSRDLIIHSNDPNSSIVRVPVNLTVTEWQPANVEYEPRAFFMIADAETDTSGVVLVHNTGSGVLIADVYLEIGAMQWLTINRRNVYLNPRLTDRILLEFHPEYAEPWVNVNNLILRYTNPDTQVAILPISYYTNTNFGTMVANIYDGESRDPLPGATIDMHGLLAESDEDGIATIPLTPPTRYTLLVTHPEYIPFTMPAVDITADQTTSVNVPMTYVELVSSLERRIDLALSPNQIDTIPGEFHNQGSGIFDYNIEFHDLNQVNYFFPWRIRATFPTAELVGTGTLYGVTFDGERFTVSGSGGDNEGKRLFVLNHDGELIADIPQPDTTFSHPLGMAGLTWDGELVWGSGRNRIFGVDGQGQVQHSLRSPLAYARSITWDPERRLFWVADARSPIYGINQNGWVEDIVDNPDSLMIYGLAWRKFNLNPELLLFCREGLSQAQLFRNNLEHDYYELLTDLSREDDERASDIFLSSSWDPYYSTLVVQYNQGEARTLLYNLSRRRDWVVLTPASGRVNAQMRQPVRLIVDATGFPGGTTLQGYFTVFGYQRGGEDTIDVTVRIEENAVRDPDDAWQPTSPTLNAFPNPFNSSLRIDYILPALARGASVHIYDILGRQAMVMPLESAGTEAGLAGSLVLDASDLSAGIYIVSLESGQAVRRQKVVLVK